MNTQAKLFIVAVCALGVAAVIGIRMSRPLRTHGDVKSNMGMTPVEELRVERRHNRNSMRLPAQAAAIQLGPVVTGENLSSPDMLEDPDQTRAWARSNPQYARDWLACAPEGAKRDTVAEMVCLQIAETNPAAAVAVADGYGAGCTNVLENLMAQWADNNIQAAYQWAAAKPPGGTRDVLLSRISFVESKTDPEDAARLVAEQIPPGQTQDEAAISVLHQWALKDPNTAMRWAQSISVGTLHDRAVNEVQNLAAIYNQ